MKKSRAPSSAEAPTGWRSPRGDCAPSLSPDAASLTGWMLMSRRVARELARGLRGARTNREQARGLHARRLRSKGMPRRGAGAGFSVAQPGQQAIAHRADVGREEVNEPILP